MWHKVVLALATLALAPVAWGCGGADPGASIDAGPNPQDAISGSDAPALGATPHPGGTTFRVWAPHANSVSVIGDFNAWDPNAHPLAPEAGGLFAADVPSAVAGQQYKYVLKNGTQTVTHLDPRSLRVTDSRGASVIS